MQSARPQHAVVRAFVGRMHGGAPGSGGPKGACNGNYKHGLYTGDRSRGAGEQDGAHCLGGDAAPEGIPASRLGGLARAPTLELARE